MIWPTGEGPEAIGADGNRFGEWAFATQTADPPRDFALIRVDEGVQTSGQMCHFGGPTDVDNDSSEGLIILHHYGNGFLTGDTVPARTAYTTTLVDPVRVNAIGVATFGDSGSPVVTEDGRALGVVIAVGATGGTGGPFFVDAGTLLIYRIGPEMEAASHALGVGLSLVTAPLL